MILARMASEESTTPDLVRLARQGYEAMNRGDLDGGMSLFAADAVYDMSAAGLETFEGAEAIRGFVEDWFRSWEDYRYEEEELLDLGHGVVLSVLREGGRLVGGKGRVEQRVAHLTTWTNGKIERYKHYPDPDEARAAAERLARSGGRRCLRRASVAYRAGCGWSLRSASSVLCCATLVPSVSWSGSRCSCLCAGGRGGTSPSFEQ